MPSYIYFCPATLALSLAAPEDMVAVFALHFRGMVNAAMGAVVEIVFLEFGRPGGRCEPGSPGRLSR